MPAAIPTCWRNGAKGFRAKPFRGRPRRRPPSAAPPRAAPARPAKRRLSFNETHALATLPGRIAALEQRIADLRATLERPGALRQGPSRLRGGRQGLGRGAIRACPGGNPLARAGNSTRGARRVLKTAREIAVRGLRSSASRLQPFDPVFMATSFGRPPPNLIRRDRRRILDTLSRPPYIQARLALARRGC